MKISLAVYFVSAFAAPGMAQEALTASDLLASGGKVEGVTTMQEYPYVIITAASKLYICGLAVDEAYKFFDYRQPNPPLSIPSRCSEIK
jgi:hypothetical protein